MRARTIAGGLGVGLTVFTAWLQTGCGTDTSGTCKDTNTCPTDASVVDAGGSDAPQGDAAAQDEGQASDGTVANETGPDGTVGDTTVVADAGAEASTDDGGGSDVGADGGVEADAAAECDGGAEPWQAACVVDDGYGVFVSSANGSDTNAGTKAQPVQTIGKGIQLAVGGDAGAKRVYVCSGSYGEQVVVDAMHDGVSVYGGFVCGDAGWQWTAGQKAQVTWSKPRYALEVVGTNKRVEIADMAFTVADAVGRDDAGAGQSSIAAFVSNEDAGVVLWRVELHAGQGTSGADAGVAPSNWFVVGDAGLESLRGNGADDAGNGGAEKTCRCPTWGTTTGGAGGIAGDPAGDGGDGTAVPEAPSQGLKTGAGGVGYPAGMLGSCLSGRNGADGLPRGDGGADSTDVGPLVATGWTPTAGSAGLPGNPGQGGGGGGGQGVNGGGGGGCGGCGGAGGLAGQGAGSSIGLLVYQAVVELKGVTVTTSTAGNGGAGGPGENGGGGGGGNVGACGGGTGGAGAGGQGGGGGAGGVSGAIVRTSTSTVTWDADGGLNWSDAGSAGAGGAGGPGGVGGAGGDVGNAGAAGGLGPNGGSGVMLTY